jgi:hypothetical protein
MATDHSHNPTAFQVCHRGIIYLALPDGEFIQPQNPDRRRLIWGFQKPLGLLSDAAAY